MKQQLNDACQAIITKLEMVAMALRVIGSSDGDNPNTLETCREIIAQRCRQVPYEGMVLFIRLDDIWCLVDEAKEEASGQDA